MARSMKTIVLMSTSSSMQLATVVLETMTRFDACLSS